MSSKQFFNLTYLDMIPSQVEHMDKSSPTLVPNKDRTTREDLIHYLMAVMPDRRQWEIMVKMASHTIRDSIDTDYEISLEIGLAREYGLKEQDFVDIHNALCYAELFIEGKQTHKCSACNGEGYATYNTNNDLCQPETTTMQTNGHPYLLHGETYWLPILQEWGEWHRNGLFFIGPNKNDTVKLNDTAYQMRYEIANRPCGYCHGYGKI